jgi:hypothetical protein
MSERHAEKKRHCALCGETFSGPPLENLCQPCGETFSFIAQFRQPAGYLCAHGTCLDCDETRRQLVEALDKLKHRVKATRITLGLGIKLPNIFGGKEPPGNGGAH